MITACVYRERDAMSMGQQEGSSMALPSSGRAFRLLLDVNGLACVLPGFNIAVLGGVITMNFCYFQENTVAAAYNGVGQAFYIVGETGVAKQPLSIFELNSYSGDVEDVQGLLAGMTVFTSGNATA